MNNKTGTTGSDYLWVGPGAEPEHGTGDDKTKRTIRKGKRKRKEGREKTRSRLEHNQLKGIIEEDKRKKRARGY